MKAGKLKRECSEKRDHIETASAVLYGLVVSVDEILLRNQQAIRRTAVVEDVLGPAVCRLVEIRQDLMTVQQEIHQAWSEEQERRWRSDYGDQDA